MVPTQLPTSKRLKRDSGDRNLEARRSDVQKLLSLWQDNDQRQVNDYYYHITEFQAISSQLSWQLIISKSRTNVLWMFGAFRKFFFGTSKNLSHHLMLSFCSWHTNTLSTECYMCAGSAPPHILAALRHHTECINTRWSLIKRVFPAGNTQIERE